MLIVTTCPIQFASSNCKKNCYLEFPRSPTLSKTRNSKRKWILVMRLNFSSRLIFLSKILKWRGVAYQSSGFYKLLKKVHNFIALLHIFLLWEEHFRTFSSLGLKMVSWLEAFLEKAGDLCDDVLRVLRYTSSYESCKT